MPKNKSHVVPINPKTGKIIKRPKKGQNVLFAVMGPRGGLKKVLSKNPQQYFKTDQNKLTEIVQNSKGGNFKIFEQVTNRNLKIKGKVQYGTDGKPKKEIKLTGADPRRRQRGLLYVKSTRRRELEFAYQTGHYKDIRATRKMILKKPDDNTALKLTLTGPTIKNALAQISLDMSFNQFVKKGMQRGLYYNVIIKITEPGGNIIWIPANSAWNPALDPVDGFSNRLTSNIKIPDAKKGEPKFRHSMKQEVTKLANLYSNMSRSIRLAMKDKGYTFTTMLKLKQISDRENKRIKKLESDPKISKQEIKGAKKAANALWNLNGTQVYDFYNEEPNLTVTKGKGYKVDVYVTFELI